MLNMNKTETIVANVDRMRENAQDQAIYKNLPLAKETLALLENLDDPEEGPLGKAYACHAIVEQLSEYDTPRIVLEILRREFRHGHIRPELRPMRGILFREQRPVLGVRYR